MAGCAYGSADDEADRCRGSWGARASGPSEKPCSVGGVRPWSSKSAGATWNWRSGARSPGRVETKRPASATFDVSIPRRKSRYRATESRRSASMSEPPPRRRVRRPVMRWSWRFRPTSGRSATTSMPRRAQVAGGADAREHQRLRRVDGSAAQHDLAAAAHGDRCAVAVRTRRPRRGRPRHRRGGTCACVHTVRLGRRRAGLRKAAAAECAAAALLREVVEARAFLVGPVEVVGERGSPACGGRSDEGAHDRVRVARGLDAQRPARAVVRARPRGWSPRSCGSTAARRRSPSRRSPARPTRRSPSGGRGCRSSR